MGSVIIEDFRTGTARAGIPHRPEIVVGSDADDAAVRQARDPLPQIKCLVVGVINGNAQPGGVQPPFPGNQRPGMLNRLRLEIITERKIAQHFKESMVSRRVADIVQIIMLAAGADAFLRRRGGGIGPRLQPGEHIFERHHPGINEHQRRVVLRHQRCRGDHPVPGTAKIVEKRPADIVGGSHSLDLGDWGAKVNPLTRSPVAHLAKL